MNPKDVFSLLKGKTDDDRKIAEQYGYKLVIVSEMPAGGIFAMETYGLTDKNGITTAEGGARIPTRPRRLR